MRIGILPAVARSSGGIYQYSVTMLHALDTWRDAGSQDDLLLFADDEASPDVTAAAKGGGWSIKPLKRPTWTSQTLNTLRRCAGDGAHRRAWRRLRSRLSRSLPPAAPLNPDAVQYRPETNRWLRDCGVDLMIYPAPTSLSFEASVPYIMAVHDLQHRLQPEFPEVSADGEWERREYRYRNGTRCATLLLADSEVGKEDILNCYGEFGVTPDQVEVLPFLPACYLAGDVPHSERQRVRRRYRLPARYVFYPAQFWPHKNHKRIVQALALVARQHGLAIPAVFLGSHDGAMREGTFREVMSLASELGCAPNIHYLGYVPDQDMSGLYAEAAALVMPTFFGPTNIPVLEAWAFGCPVLTSDIRGIREQVGDAGLLVDPQSVEAIANGIYRLWSDPGLACRLAEGGRQRLGRYTPEDYRDRLVNILEEARGRIHASNRHARSVR
jgi:glycosyltransferase involved in cell wall biosynthesis